MTSNSTKEEDIFDAFGLRDDNNNTNADAGDADDFDPFGNSRTNDSAAENDPFAFDPFQVNDGASPARGFKKQPKLPPPPSSASPARSTASKAFDAAFDIGTSTPYSSAPFPLDTPPSTSANTTTTSVDASMTKGATPSKAALPPRLDITFLLHEEATSHVAHVSGRGGGSVVSAQSACNVSIEGAVQALVQSSDATRNGPFQLVLRDPQNTGGTKIAINKAFVDANYKVTIPKTSIGNVPIASYKCSAENENMPVLVQSKVSMKENSIRVDVQVRSNLNNSGDLDDFTLAVPVPPCIVGASITVSKGEGVYDDLKRVIKWKRETLPRGESFLVGFQGQILSIDGELKLKSGDIPILLRCKSAKDKISTVEVDATAVEGHPSTVVTVRKCSFRLLHRVTR